MAASCTLVTLVTVLVRVYPESSAEKAVYVLLSLV